VLDKKSHISAQPSPLTVNREYFIHKWRKYIMYFWNRET